MKSSDLIICEATEIASQLTSLMELLFERGAGNGLQVNDPIIGLAFNMAKKFNSFCRKRKNVRIRWKLMQNIVERNRTRLVNIYLSEMVRKTGNMVTTAKLPDGSMTTVQLDSGILNTALIKLFETAVRKSMPGDAADREIAETYSECVKIKSGKLSAIGEGFMEALISNLTELAFS